MAEERELEENERSLVVRILEGSSFPGARELIAQARTAKVTGGLPTFLDLAVEGPAPRAPCNDGPIPGRALVEGDDGRPWGEVIVWVKDGYLSGLEFAWVTDETPMRMPAPDRVRMEA